MNAADWARYSLLLDEALDLPPAERAAWLASLTEQDPEAGAALAGLLQKALAAQAALDQGPTAQPPFQQWVSEAALAGDGRARGQQFGPWRLLRPLGQGGMGEVWLAARTDGLYEGEAALKFIRSGLAAAPLASRFARERRLLALLHHPGIARLLDAGVTDGTAAGQPYLVLEYVPGAPLLEHAAAQRATVAQRVRLLLAAAQAVEYAHGQLVAHRDLKPSNILVTPDGVVKLLDFGIAALLDEDRIEDDHTLTKLTGRALTPGYAAPEQIAGEPSGAPVDVFALGVLLHQLLCGQRPFAPAETSRAAIEHAVLHQRPQTLRAALAARAGDQPPDAAQALGVAPIIEKALQRQPRDRYPGVAGLIDDLQRWLAHRPLAAAITPWPRRLALWLRRHRLLAAATTAVVLSLSLGVLATLRQAAIAERERDRAEEEAVRANAVRDYLVYMFREADAKAKSADQDAAPLSARAVLDLAASQIRERFASDPKTARDVFWALGELYFTMKDRVGTAPLLEGYLKLVDADTPPAQVATVRARLSEVEFDLGHEARAAELLAQAKAFWLGEPVRWADPLLQTLQRESIYFREKGLNAEASAMLKQHLDLTLEAKGADSAEAAVAWGYYGDSLALLQRADESMSAMAQGWATLEKIGQLTTPDTVTYLSSWGRAANRLKRYADGERVLTRARAIDSELFAPSAQTASTTLELATSVFQQGRVTEAEPLVDAAVQLTRQFAGETGFMTLRARFLKSETWIATGDFAASERELAQLEPLIRTTFGDGEVLLSRVWMQQALIRIRQQRLPEAKALIEKARPLVEGYGSGPNAFKTQLADVSSQYEAAAAR